MKMDQENLEFFKLDIIDRKVLLWLLEHVPQKSIVAWMDYIAIEYRNRKAIAISPEKLFHEMFSNENETPLLQQISL